MDKISKECMIEKNEPWESGDVRRHKPKVDRFVAVAGSRFGSPEKQIYFNSLANCG